MKTGPESGRRTDGAADAADVVGLCQSLVRIPSVMREEGKLAAYAAEQMEHLGFESVRIDAMGNVFGRVSGTARAGAGEAREPRRLLLDAHIDTIAVTEPSKWTVDPFGGEVRDGKVFGRGSSDMKGSFAAMLTAGAALARDRSAFSGEFWVAGTVCEEVVEGPSLGFVMDQVSPTWVVIGEATSLNLNVGQRGRAEIQVTTYGRPAHSSTPHLGVNAVDKMTRLMGEIKLLELGRDELLGPAIMALTAVQSRPYPGQSVVPDRCSATYDRRLLVGEEPEFVLDQVRQAIKRLALEDSTFSADVDLAKAVFDTYTGHHMERVCFARAWKTSVDSPLVRGSLAGLRAAGLSPKMAAYAFCTNGSESAGLRGVPTVGFGPGNEAQAHTVDEHVEINSLRAAASGFEGLARALLLPEPAR